MNLSTFDQYQVRDSLIHRLDPRIKIVVTVLVIVSNVLLPDGAWLAFVGSWVLLLAINYMAGLKGKFLLARSLVALPFALAAVSVIFTLPGESILAIGFGSSVVVVTEAGLLRFASILLRSWISVQAAIVMAATTSFPDLIHGLRHLHIPPIIVAIISFMYRYLFVLSDETLRLLRARESRSAIKSAPSAQKAMSFQRLRVALSPGGGTLVWRARVAGNMVGQLFLRSFERSDRIYHAMLARGYQGQLLTMNPHRMKQRDWFFGGIAVIALILMQILGRIG